MRIRAMVIVMLVSAIHSAYGQTTYTGLFYAWDGMGMHTDQWLNLIPNSGATSANYWNVYHKDGGSIFQVHFGAALPFVQVGLSKPTNFFVNGNVGIGTTTPQWKLDVNGIIGINGIGVVNTNNNANDIYINSRVIRNESTVYPDGMYVNYNSTGGASAHLKFYANGTTERMRIDANTGNVGIGTSTPSSRLAIVGAQSMEETILNITNASDQDFHVRLSGSGASVKRTIIGPSTANRFSLGVGLTEQITMVNGGNVGIGTTSPTQKLTVNGTIYGKEVKVDLSVPGPDYVFANNYQLLTLNELKTYIDQNKHLPEVPSAKEMEANGINVGEMNMLLLKKIEELTLYVIDLKTENERNGSTINQLKTRLDTLEKQKP